MIIIVKSIVNPIFKGIMSGLISIELKVSAKTSPGKDISGGSCKNG